MTSAREIQKATMNLRRFASRAATQTAVDPDWHTVSISVPKTVKGSKWFGLIATEETRYIHRPKNVFQGWLLWSGNHESNTSSGARNSGNWSVDESRQEIWLKTDGELMIADIGTAYGSGQTGGATNTKNLRKATNQELRLPDQYWKRRTKKSGSYSSYYDSSRPRYNKPCMGLSLAVKERLKPPASRSR